MEDKLEEMHRIVNKWWNMCILDGSYENQCKFEEELSQLISNPMECNKIKIQTTQREEYSFEQWLRDYHDFEMAETIDDEDMENSFAGWVSDDLSPNDWILLVDLYVTRLSTQTEEKRDSEEVIPVERDMSTNTSSEKEEHVNEKRN